MEERNAAGKHAAFDQHFDPIFQQPAGTSLESTLAKLYENKEL
jgi:hypothetical protein